MAGHLWRSGRRRQHVAKSSFAVSGGRGVHGGAYARQGRREFDCEGEYLGGRAVHANLSDIKSNSPRTSILTAWLTTAVEYGRCTRPPWW